MSQLDTHFGDAAGQLSDDLADTVGYSPDGVVAPVNVVAIIGQEVTRTVMEQDGEKSRYVRTVSLPLTTQAAGGGAFVAAVQPRNQLTINGLIYVIEAIMSQTVNWAHVEAHRLVVHEKTRQGYRRRA